MSLKMLSRQFISHNEILYKRAPTGVHLRCVDEDEAQRLMGAVHEGGVLFAYEWNSFGQEDSTSRLLLVDNGERLPKICEKVS